MAAEKRLFFYRFGVFNAEGFNRYLLHDLRDTRLVIIVGTHGADLVNFLNTLYNLAESSVLAVEVWGVLVHDEELAAGGIGSHGACHGENTAVVEQIVFEAVRGELAVYAVVRSSDTGALGVAALYHEARNNTVENKPVIKALADEGDKIVDGIRSDLGVELGLHYAAVFHFKCDYRIAHK